MVAAAPAETGMLVAHLPPGAILIVRDTDQNMGMVRIVYEGRNLSVFVEDLQQCAECVDQRGA